ncbi:hypothetical protein [Streptomyces griseomycini]|uniref:Uncharacterized protein n=1 Tax=Streptomyces griseomycini TaxID=66895 RepID=A0A7W7PWD5_9ACTN|nr:hypothetical protein [Streptomyces griseomycini]MBB4902582.1 hypothetical protein [Streptomyces griseomycini]GGR54301.1 hypothetical protein GCM10015536_69530 [Streptomyces griseomycini]
MAVTTNPNLVRAVRTRAIADVVRTRATERPDVAAVLLQIAGFLDASATAFEAEEPDVVDGITLTNVLPFEASMPLVEARWLVEETPGTGLPADFTAYVLEPFSRRAMPTPPVKAFTAAGVGRRTRAAAVLAQLAEAHDALHAARGTEAVTACLQTALNLHDAYDRIMTAPAAPAAPARVAPAPAAPAPLDLTGLTPYTVSTLQLAEKEGFRLTDGGTYRGVRRIHLNAGGKHGTFGTIQIGKRSGKVLRAEVVQGNNGTPRRAQGASNVRLLLAATHVHSCPDGCTALFDCRR